MNVILDLCLVPIGVGVSLSPTWPPVRGQKAGLNLIFSISRWQP